MVLWAGSLGSGQLSGSFARLAWAHLRWCHQFVAWLGLDGLEFPCSCLWRLADFQPEHLVSFPCDLSSRLTWASSPGGRRVLSSKRQQALMPKCFSGFCLCHVCPLKQVMLLPRFRRLKRKTLPLVEKSCPVTLQWGIQTGMARISDNYLSSPYLC